MKKRLKNLIPQFSKFIVVGGLNTLIDFVVFNTLSLLLDINKGVGAAIITSISFTVANINSYFFNKNWTFQEATAGTTFIEKKDTIKFGEFFLVSIIGLLINVLVVFVVTTYIPPFLHITFFDNLFSSVEVRDLMWANVAKVIAIAFSLVWNFIGYKLIVFKK